MIWRVVLTRQAEKQLQGLGTPARRRVVEFLNDRAANRADPRELAKRMAVQAEEMWRFRVGDYRVLVRFDDNEMIILVIGLGKRSEIYR